MKSPYPTTNCGTCGRKVYKGKAPNTCAVAACGLFLVEWPNGRMPARCRRVLTNKSMARHTAAFAGRYYAIVGKTQPERNSRASKFSWAKRRARRHAAEMGER